MTDNWPNDDSCFKSDPIDDICESVRKIQAYGSPLYDFDTMKPAIWEPGDIADFIRNIEIPEGTHLEVRIKVVSNE